VGKAGLLGATCCRFSGFHPFRRSLCGCVSPFIPFFTGQREKVGPRVHKLPVQQTVRDPVGAYHLTGPTHRQRQGGIYRTVLIYIFVLFTTKTFDQGGDFALKAFGEDDVSGTAQLGVALLCRSTGQSASN
jgi:hypothetical protein